MAGQRKVRRRGPLLLRTCILSCCAPFAYGISRSYLSCLEGTCSEQNGQMAAARYYAACVQRSAAAALRRSAARMRLRSWDNNISRVCSTSTLLLPKVRREYLDTVTYTMIP